MCSWLMFESHCWLISLCVSQKMAVWLQAGTLLFLLAFYTAGTNAGTSQYLCGADLVDALYLVCGPMFYNPKREADPLLGKEEVIINESPVFVLCFKSINNFSVSECWNASHFSPKGSFRQNLVLRVSWLNTRIKIIVWWWWKEALWSCAVTNPAPYMTCVTTATKTPSSPPP